MTGQRKSAIGRALAELGIVFLGVLIALAADAWRESIVEARRENEYIESLRSDMLQAVSNMEEAASVLGQGIDRVSDFVSALSSNVPLPDSLVEAPLSTASVVVPTGTLDAFVEGGAIELVDDAGLRSHILTERAEIKSWVEVLGRQDLMFQQNYGDWIKIRAVIRHDLGLQATEIPATAYVDQPEMLGVYRNHLSMTGNRRFVASAIGASAQRLLDALEGER